MKAKDYAAKLNSDEEYSIVDCFIDLMKEVEAIAISRRLGERLPTDQLLTILRELNTKWYAIHRKLNLPQATRIFFKQACSQQWPLVAKEIMEIK